MPEFRVEAPSPIAAVVTGGHLSGLLDEWLCLTSPVAAVREDIRLHPPKTETWETLQSWIGVSPAAARTLRDLAADKMIREAVVGDEAVDLGTEPELLPVLLGLVVRTTIRLGISHTACAVRALMAKDQELRQRSQAAAAAAAPEWGRADGTGRTAQWQRRGGVSPNA
jgi:hypothetical protein